MKEEKVRLFVAIDLPEIVLAKVKCIQNELKKANLFEGRYIDHLQVHITMKFIGEVNSEQVANIDAVLQQISLAPYQAQLGGVDVFTVGNKIKIIYLNVIVPGLVQLAQKLDQLLQPWCAPEPRPFISHATIARVKTVQDNQKLLGFLRELKVEPIKFTVDSFVLKESALLPEGAEYRTIREYELK